MSQGVRVVVICLTFQCVHLFIFEMVIIIVSILLSCGELISYGTRYVSIFNKW